MSTRVDVRPNGSFLAVLKSRRPPRSPSPRRTGQGQLDQHQATPGHVLVVIKFCMRALAFNIEDPMNMRAENCFRGHRYGDRACCDCWILATGPVPVTLQSVAFNLPNNVTNQQPYASKHYTDYEQCTGSAP